MKTIQYYKQFLKNNPEEALEIFLENAFPKEWKSLKENAVIDTGVFDEDVDLFCSENIVGFITAKLENEIEQAKEDEEEETLKQREYERDCI